MGQTQSRVDRIDTGMRFIFKTNEFYGFLRLMNFRFTFDVYKHCLEPISVKTAQFFNDLT